MTKKTHPPAKNSLAPPATSEFAGYLSRPFAVDDLVDGAITRDLEARPEECQAIAKAFALPALASLQAHLTLAQMGGVVQVRGTLKAHVTQQCVVSLDVFDTWVDEPIEIDFADLHFVHKAEDAWAKRSEEEEAGEMVAEPPDPIIDGQIDLGAVVVEFFILALDPYPRKEGVVFAPRGESEPEKLSPFAALAQLKDQKPHS